MFLAWKKSENDSKKGPKSQKKLPGHPTSATTRCKPKKWIQKIEKHEFFFHFFLAEVWRAGPRTSPFRTVFYSVLWRRASRPIKNRRFFPKNAPPPQVNPNLSSLMPSGWSRPLHLRCGRISLHFITFHYSSLHFITFHYISLHFITFHYISLHFITFHYMTFYIPLQFIIPSTKPPEWVLPPWGGASLVPWWAERLARPGGGNRDFASPSLLGEMTDSDR